MTPKKFFETLELDLAAKLLEELLRLLGCMPSVALSSYSVEAVDNSQGVYQLYRDDQLVYIGKTDSDAGLKTRLSRHLTKIQGRKNLSPDQVRFKAVRVLVFAAMDLETLLIDSCKERGEKLEWQHSGFGSNDPGRKRDTSNIKEGHFDAKHPIDLAHAISIRTTENPTCAAELLLLMKSKSPYLIRFQGSGSGRSPHNDLVAAKLKIGAGEHSIISLLKEIKRAIGYEWQITALPGYVIIYKENAPKKYPSGKIIGI